MKQINNWAVKSGNAYLLLISSTYEVRTSLFICNGDPRYDVFFYSKLRGNHRTGIPRLFELTEEETYSHIIFEAVGENV